MNVRAWLNRIAAGSQPRSHAGASPASATYESDFADFLVQRRGLDPARARESIARSQAQFEGGWSGPAYRDFTEHALQVLQPLYDDTSEAELYRTYQIHAPFDFLRMLSYRIPEPAEYADVVAVLALRQTATLVDYGCGLAQRSLAISRAVQQRGVAVRLILVDIPRTPHIEFLSFLCGRHGIAQEFLPVDDRQPFPSLPPHDYCDAVNVLEHLRDPRKAIANIDASLAPGGLLLASVADQETEMMHVSPNLTAVRDRLESLGYRKRRDWLDATLFDKPVARG